MIVITFVLYIWLKCQVEIARGVFPYPEWKSVFDQLNQVVNGDPPIVTKDEGYSVSFMNFVNMWLVISSL